MRRGVILPELTDLLESARRRTLARSILSWWRRWTSSAAKAQESSPYNSPFHGRARRFCSASAALQLRMACRCFSVGFGFGPVAFFYCRASMPPLSKAESHRKIIVRQRPIERITVTGDSPSTAQTLQILPPVFCATGSIIAPQPGQLLCAPARKGCSCRSLHLGHFRHGLPQSHEAYGLGFELCCVSFSGHWIHCRLFLYLLVQKSRAPQSTLAETNETRGRHLRADPADH